LNTGSQGSLDLRFNPVLAEMDGQIYPGLVKNGLFSADSSLAGFEITSHFKTIPIIFNMRIAVLSSFYATLLAGVHLAAQQPGSFDLSFAVQDESILDWQPVAVQTDGKIIVERNFYGAVPLHLVLARVNADGSYDTGFRPTALSCENVGTDEPPVVTIQPDGKILVALTYGCLTSSEHQYPLHLVRLLSNGELDRGFAPAPSVEWEQDLGCTWHGGQFVREIAPTRPRFLLRPNGGILLGFRALHGDGTIDPEFNPILPWVSVRNEPYPVPTTFTSDGRVFGAYWTASGWTVFRLLRDGSPDHAFAGPTADTFISHLLEVQEGKLLLAGAFSEVNGRARNGLARLNRDGSLDDAFAPFSSAWEARGVGAVQVQRDGKILAGGAFWKQGATAPLLLARLNVDGTLDSSYRDSSLMTATWLYGSVADIHVTDLLLQPNEDVLATLRFTRLPEKITVSTTFRLHGDGWPYILPASVRANGKDGLTFEIAAATNRNVFVEATSNLNQPVWDRRGSFPPAVNRGRMTFTDHADGAPFPQQRFYRVVSP
jgi:uncharacterized delta-60 repeat protein